MSIINTKALLFFVSFASALNSISVLFVILDLLNSKGNFDTTSIIKTAFLVFVYEIGKNISAIIWNKLKEKIHTSWLFNISAMMLTVLTFLLSITTSYTAYVFIRLASGLFNFMSFLESSAIMELYINQPKPSALYQIPGLHSLSIIMAFLLTLLIDVQPSIYGFNRYAVLLFMISCFNFIVLILNMTRKANLSRINTVQTMRQMTTRPNFIRKNTAKSDPTSNIDMNEKKDDNANDNQVSKIMNISTRESHGSNNQNNLISPKNIENPFFKRLETMKSYPDQQKEVNINAAQVNVQEAIIPRKNSKETTLAVDVFSRRNSITDNQLKTTNKIALTLSIIYCFLLSSDTVFFNFLFFLLTVPSFFGGYALTTQETLVTFTLLYCLHGILIYSINRNLITLSNTKRVYLYTTGLGCLASLLLIVAFNLRFTEYSILYLSMSYLLVQTLLSISIFCHHKHTGSMANIRLLENYSKFQLLLSQPVKTFIGFIVAGFLNLFLIGVNNYFLVNICLGIVFVLQIIINILIRFI